MELAYFCYHCMREDALKNNRVCRFCGHSGNTAAPMGALPPGSILQGKYLLGDTLGVGGYGITYRALDIAANIRMAIKEYRPELFSMRQPGTPTLVPTSQEDFDYGLKHFLSESQTLSSLQFIPEVVRYYDSFIENGTSYYVMELLEGQDLLHYLISKGGKISFEEAVEITMPAILALHRVHLTGTLHRDISPDNIYICNNGSVRVIDFGAARQDSNSFSRSYMPVEKEGFSPPEQHTIQRNGPNQGPWSDVYAMAGTIYRCVAGKRPPAATARMAGEELERLCDIDKSVTQQQSDVIEKSLSLPRKNRCQSMQEFANELVASLSPRKAAELNSRYVGLSAYSSPPVEEPYPVQEEKQQPIAQPQSDDSVLHNNSSENVNNLQHNAYLWRRIVAYLVDAVVFLGLPGLLQYCLKGTVFLWLVVAYITGVVICGILMASDISGSIGQRLFGLRIRNKQTCDRLSMLKALAYCAMYLCWPLMPAHLLAVILMGEDFGNALLDTSIVHDAVSEEKAGNFFESGSKNSIPNNIEQEYAPPKVSLVYSLDIIGGYYKGKSVSLSPGVYVFGRDPEKCNMIYPANSRGISRRQMQLTVEEYGNVFITDLNSSYGTAVDGRRIQAGISMQVRPEQIITFGDEVMVLKKK